MTESDSPGWACGARGLDAQGHGSLWGLRRGGADVGGDFCQNPSTCSLEMGLFHYT